jgi:hypothetical protein
MNRGLVIALAATLAAVWYASGLEEASAPELAVPAAAADGRRTVRAAQPTQADAPEIRRAPEPVVVAVARDIFAAHSFLPPPAPDKALRAAKPPLPMAPPLPFRYQGRLVEAGGTTVFLTQGDRMLVARAGDLLGNQYRVESVSASAVTFIFEPLKQRQTLTIGSAK